LAGYSKAGLTAEKVAVVQAVAAALQADPEAVLESQAAPEADCRAEQQVAAREAG